jgi:hypothetical protein
LPSPFPLTYGGTPVPANGLAVGLERSDGLRGQEVQRTELIGPTIGIGVGDRVSVSAASLVPRRNGEGFPVWSAKVRLGDLFGPRSSASVHVAWSRAHREDRPAQADRVSTIDVALPVEFLTSRPAARPKLSLYAGPRITRENYSDDIDPSQSMRHVYFGALGGAHVSYRALHLFGEVTLLYVPTSRFHGVTYGGQLTVMPAVGVLVRLGHDHKWEP